MTAEIAIMNKTAVALAADSKVTVGGAGRQKTYDTVNKVFTLSKIYPVGVMIYGNAEFMGYAWELIIKQYRKTNGSVKKDTVKDCANDFIAFAKIFGNVSDDEKRNDTIDVLCAVLDEVERIAFQRANREGVDIGSKSFSEIICAVLRREIRALDDESLAFDPEYIDHFKDSFLGCIT